jgi:hypothetical protein
MPSTSKKQHNFMAAIANNPAFAKKVGIKPSVGEEFLKADKSRKFKEGGAMKHSDIKMDKKVVKKAVSMHDKQQHGGKKTDLAALKKGGKVKKFALGGMSQGQMPPQMPAGLTMRRPFGGGGSSGAYGGLDTVNQGTQQVGRSLDTIGGALGKPGGDSMRAQIAQTQPGMMKKGGAVKSKKMASGGKVGQLSKADGCAVKGKTKGSMVKMKKGGSC